MNSQSTPNYYKYNNKRQQVWEYGDFSWKVIKQHGIVDILTMF